MSGHSKWSKIHRAKELTDKKKGLSFTKLSNAITLAVKEGGGIGDVDFNFKLRLAVERARESNMPKENIRRAIDRAVNKGEGSSLEEIVYEGYGPSGVGFLVQAYTDNKQRTVQDVKNIFDRHHGSIASPGSVLFNFNKMGYLEIFTSGDIEESTLKIIDLGVEDIIDAGEGILDVYVKPENLMLMKDKLVFLGFSVKSAEIIQKPVNFISVSDRKTASDLLDLFDGLEELDDVQRVFVNFDIPEEYLYHSALNLQ